MGTYNLSNMALSICLWIINANSFLHTCSPYIPTLFWAIFCIEVRIIFGETWRFLNFFNAVLTTNNFIFKKIVISFSTLKRKEKEKFPRSEFLGLRDYNYFTTHTLLNIHSCLLAKAADTNLAHNLLLHKPWKQRKSRVLLDSLYSAKTVCRICQHSSINLIHIHNKFLHAAKLYHLVESWHFNYTYTFQCGLQPKQGLIACLKNLALWHCVVCVIFIMWWEIY